MRPPPLPREYEVDHRFTPEEMRALMRPCPICGAVEPELTPGVFGNIRHDYAKHDIPVPASNRLTTERLMDLPDAAAFDRLGDRREA